MFEELPICAVQPVLSRYLQQVQQVQQVQLRASGGNPTAHPNPHGAGSPIWGATPHTACALVLDTSSILGDYCAGQVLSTRQSP